MSQEFCKRPRFDVLKVESDHKRWALHTLAFKYDCLPTHLRHYHKDRDPDGDLGQGYYDEYIPVADGDKDRGIVLGKEIEELTVTCPDCEIAAKRTEIGEPVCPECGMICDDVVPTYELIADAKTAKRITGQVGFSH